ncbi:MAG TPA: DNA polymerase [Candidatus Paceibacterota bacterium]
MKTLLLIDSHALIHRAYHALPPFTSPKGEPTGALYGFSTMMLRALNDFKPDYVVAAFDLPGKTFRHEAYEEYKAKRPSIEDALISQLKKLPELAEAFGVYCLNSPGFEADDVLGAIVEKIKKEKDLKVIIVSGDMDILQLVEDDKIVVYTMKKGVNDTVTYNENKVFERYGFDPKLIPDFKGLKGDPSDNIVGVRGIGEKTATDLIKKFGTLENLYKNLKGPTKAKILVSKEIKDRTINLLLEHEEDAFFSKTLATIRKDAPVDFSLEKAKFSLKKEKLTEMFLELGFNSLVKRLGDDSPTVLNSNVSSGANPTSILPIFSTNTLSFVLVRDGKIFGNPDFNKKIISNDIKNLIKLSGNPPAGGPKDFFDLTIANWAADSEKRTIDLPKNPEEALALLPDFYQKILKKIKEKNVERIVYEIEFPLIPILAEMEKNGIGLDEKFLTKFKKEISGKIGKIEEKIQKTTGENFNINSPAQVGEILAKLGIAGRARTATGKISTKESELFKLKDKHPVINFLLEHREISKLFSTYVNPLLELARAQGKAHTTFNQTGTVTGRLSSDSPNLQNIPIRSELGSKIRNAFVSSPGFSFLSFDYSQIELKILAVLSGDEKMINAFKKGMDVHAMVASEINNVSRDKITTAMRSHAKTINFGIVFGMGVRKLAQSTGMSQQDAQKFYDEYFKDFPKVKLYIEKVKKEAKELGFVSTLFGRKRFFDLEKTKYDRFLQSEMERMAFNAVIQGSDSDIVKKAMAEIHQKMDSANVRPILQIHDELLYEVRDDIFKVSAPKMKEIMENVVKFPIPLSVEVKSGKNWGNLKHLNI